MSDSDHSTDSAAPPDLLPADPLPADPALLQRTHRRQPEDREQGVQPLAALMQTLQLSASDLVSASPRQLTHKMVSRAVRGRWLTINSRRQVHEAFCLATGTAPHISQLFNY